MTIEMTADASREVGTHPEAMPLIESACSAALGFFNSPAFAVEWFVNPEDPADRHLFLVIRSDMEPDALFDAHDRFLTGWWLDHASPLLAVTVEPAVREVTL